MDPRIRIRLPKFHGYSTLLATSIFLCGRHRHPDAEQHLLPGRKPEASRALQQPSARGAQDGAQAAQGARPSQSQREQHFNH
jgi:hypothetical protein